MRHMDLTGVTFSLWQEYGQPDTLQVFRDHLFSRLSIFAIYEAISFCRTLAARHDSPDIDTYLYAVEEVRMK